MKPKPTPVDGLQLLTKDDVQKRLGIGVRLLDTLIKTGEIKRLKIGRYIRFTQKDVADYIQHLRDIAS